MASWLSALLALCALLLGVFGASRPDVPRRWGEWALAGSALAAAVATAALVTLLLAGDVTVRYVARTITTSLVPGYRAAALWQLPGGAVLPAATFAALFGGMAASRARTPVGVAAVGATVTALLASSLAASPFATLPWVPADGLGLDAALQHPLSIVGRAALGVAVAIATAAVALAMDELALPTPVAGDDQKGTARGDVVALRLRIGLLAVVGTATWAWSGGDLATGVVSSSVETAHLTGALVAPLIAAALALDTEGQRGTPSLSSALGTLGLLASVLLGHATASTPWAARAFVLLSLGACVVGVVRGWSPVVPGRSNALPRMIATIGRLSLVAGAGMLAWHPASTARVWSDGATGFLLVGGSAAALVHYPFTHVKRPPAAASWGSRRMGIAWVLLVIAGVAVGGRMVPITRPAAWWGVVAALALSFARCAMAADERRSLRLSAVARALALACAAIAAVGAGAATSRTIDLASGAQAVVPMRLGPPVTLVHQGISRFEDGNAHTAALALEPRRAGRALGVASPDLREYVDSRQEILGPPLARPAVVRFPLEELRITVEALDEDQSARLRVSVVPFAAFREVAVAWLLVSAFCLLVAGGRREGTP